MVPVVKLVSCPSSVNDHRNWRQLLAMAVYRESALSRGPDAAAEDGRAVYGTTGISCKKDGRYDRIGESNATHIIIDATAER